MNERSDCEMNCVKECTNFQSQKRLESLKKRTKRCVCKYCGGNLKLRRIIFSDFEDARIEIFCDDCNRIEFGVEPAIYSSAKFFVENSKFNCYPDMDDNELTKQMTIAKVAEIISWGSQNLGFLNSDGFIVPLRLNENFIGECITLSEDDLNSEVEIEDKFAL
jgi:hypothetical protein